MSDVGALTHNQRVIVALYSAAVLCRARCGPPRDPGAALRDAMSEAIAEKRAQMQLCAPDTPAYQEAAMQLARWEEALRLNR